MVQTETLSDRQTQIVEVAMGILATHGARRFTVQLLADEVGVTGGAIYRHFPSMEAIVGAVVSHMAAVLFEGFPAAEGEPVPVPGGQEPGGCAIGERLPPDGLRSIERLRLFFERRVQILLTHPSIARLLLSDQLAQLAGIAGAAPLEELKRRSRGFVRECLREAEAAGALAPGLTTEVASVIVVGAILALAQERPRARREGQGGALAGQVWAALERMLRGPRESETSTTAASEPPWPPDHGP